MLTIHDGSEVNMDEKDVRHTVAVNAEGKETLSQEKPRKRISQNQQSFILKITIF